MWVYVKSVFVQKIVTLGVKNIDYSATVLCQPTSLLKMSYIKGSKMLRIIWASWITIYQCPGIVTIR